MQTRFSFDWQEFVVCINCSECTITKDSFIFRPYLLTGIELAVFGGLWGLDSNFAARQRGGCRGCRRGMVSPGSSPPITPDGRYFVVRERLWRCANPALSDAERERLVRKLMQARREKGVAMRAGDMDMKEKARAAVDDAELRLGERGDVWWKDGAKDWNRHTVLNTPYAKWFERLKRA